MTPFVWLLLVWLPLVWFPLLWLPRVWLPLVWLPLGPAPPQYNHHCPPVEVHGDITQLHCSVAEAHYAVVVVAEICCVA